MSAPTRLNAHIQLNSIPSSSKKLALITSIPTNILKNTLTSLRNDPCTYKEVKFFSRTANTICKLSGYDDIATVTGFIKKCARSEGIYKFMSQGKLNAKMGSLNMQDPNKSIRKIIKKLWVVFTFLNQMCIIGYATGLISNETTTAIALSQYVSKYAKKSLSIPYAMSLGYKAYQISDSPKVTLWNYCFLRGILKIVVLAMKLTRINKKLGQITSLVVGGMSLIKRKHFVPEKKRAKLKKIELIKAQILEGNGIRQDYALELILDPTSPKRKADPVTYCLISFRILILMALITEIYLAQVNAPSFRA